MSPLRRHHQLSLVPDRAESDEHTHSQKKGLPDEKSSTLRPSAETLTARALVRSIACLERGADMMMVWGCDCRG